MCVQIPASPDYSPEEAFKNTVVLREIFKFLSVKDLLSASVVNRSWNFEARCYLRDCRDCVVKILGASDRSCHMLRRLDRDLGNMTIVPYNGLQVTLGTLHQWADYKNVESVCENLFRAFVLKHLSVSWTSSSPDPCPGNQFIVKLFLHYGSTIEKLTLQNIDPSFDLDDSDVEGKKLWLPKLKVLELDNWDNAQDAVQQVFEISPNLKRIAGPMCPRILRGIPDRKYNLLDQFRVCVESISDEQVCLQLAENPPALRELFVDFPRSIQVRLLPAMLEELLLSSQTTLEKLTLDSGPFITLGQLSPSFPPLKRLKQFTLISHETTEMLLHTLRTTDYANLLPSLEYVQLFVRPDLRREWEPTFGMQHGMPHPCKTVSTLELETDGETISLADMKNIFPNISTLRITWEGSGADIPFEDMWRLWPSLKFLDLTIRRGTEALYENFDSVFCGISTEEADDLRMHKSDHLRKMHIVPIRPSLSTMLRKFI